MPYVESGYLEEQYRYFGQPGTPARFTACNSATLNFEQPPLRPPVDLALLQADVKSAADVRFGCPVYGSEEVFRLRWPRLYLYYRDRLLDWFLNVVRGQADSFVYRDPNGIDWTVRFASPELPEILEIAPDRYRVDLDLVIEL